MLNLKNVHGRPVQRNKKLSESRSHGAFRCLLVSNKPLQKTKKMPEKPMKRKVIEVLGTLLGAKSKLLNFSFILASKSFVWMREFQIWSQNWKGTTFTSFLATKGSKPGKFGYFASYWPFSAVFWSKGGQILSDFKFETTFGILSFRRNFLTPKLKKIDNFFAPYM